MPQRALAAPGGLHAMRATGERAHTPAAPPKHESPTRARAATSLLHPPPPPPQPRRAAPPPPTPRSPGPAPCPLACRTRRWRATAPPHNCSPFLALKLPWRNPRPQPLASREMLSPGRKQTPCAAARPATDARVLLIEARRCQTALDPHNGTRMRGVPASPGPHVSTFLCSHLPPVPLRRGGPGRSCCSSSHVRRDLPPTQACDARWRSGRPSPTWPPAGMIRWAHRGLTNLVSPAAATGFVLGPAAAELCTASGGCRLAGLPHVQVWAWARRAQTW